MGYFTNKRLPEYHQIKTRFASLPSMERPAKIVPPWVGPRSAFQAELERGGLRGGVDVGDAGGIVLCDSLAEDLLGCNSIDTLHLGAKLGAKMCYILGQIQHKFRYVSKLRI